MTSIDDDWAAFCNDNYENKDNMDNISDISDISDISEIKSSTLSLLESSLELATRASTTSSFAKCTELYISTQTKISYLNMPIILNDVFWKIPILPYHIPSNGVVKKQMKFN